MAGFRRAFGLKEKIARGVLVESLKIFIGHGMYPYFLFCQTNFIEICLFIRFALLNSRS